MRDVSLTKDGLAENMPTYLLLSMGNNLLTTYRMQISQSNEHVDHYMAYRNDY